MQLETFHSLVEDVYAAGLTKCGAKVDAWASNLGLRGLDSQILGCQVVGSAWNIIIFHNVQEYMRREYFPKVVA